MSSQGEVEHIDENIENEESHNYNDNENEKLDDKSKNGEGDHDESDKTKAEPEQENNSPDEVEPEHSEPEPEKPSPQTNPKSNTVPPKQNTTDDDEMNILISKKIDNDDENSRRLKENLQKDLEKDAPPNLSTKPKNENFSNYSKSDSMSEIFQDTRHNNLTRIRKEIEEIQNNAVEYTKTLIRLGKYFERMKRNINTLSNSIFTSLFSFFGYTYPKNTPNNLFTFATQAWLLEIIKSFEHGWKNLTNSEQNNLKYFNLLKFIKISGGDIKEENFLTNFGILTGNLLNRNRDGGFNNTKILTATVIEDTIGRNYLESITNVIRNDFEIIKEDTTKKEFDKILMDIFKKAVDNTLNLELKFASEGVDGRNNFNFYQTYNDMKNRSQDHIKFSPEEYFNNVKENSKKVELSAIDNSGLKMSCDAYYTFSSITLDEILLDIKFFVKNYSSILYKTKMFLTQTVQNVFKFNEKVYNSLNSFRKYFEKENIKSALYSCGRKALVKSAKLTKTCEIKYKQIKQWVLESYKIIPEFAYKLKETITHPIQQVVILRRYVVDKCEVGLEKYNEIKNKITERIYDNVSGLCEYIDQKFNKAIILKESDDKQRYEIVIKRDLIVIDPKNLKKVYKLIERILKESYSYAEDRGKALKDEVKKYCLEKYKKFLSCEAGEK
jgi:hypothetical protein